MKEGNQRDGGGSDTAANQKQVHHCYEFTARGCPAMLYGVIKEDEKDVYAGLLASRDLFTEHPRRTEESMDAVLGLKPLWLADAASYGWSRSEFDEEDAETDLPAGTDDKGVEVCNANEMKVD